MKVETGAEDLDLVPFWVSFLKTLRASKQIKSKDPFVFQNVSLRHPCRFHEHVASCRPQQNMVDGMHSCLLPRVFMHVPYNSCVRCGSSPPAQRLVLLKMLLHSDMICNLQEKMFWGGLGCQDIRPVFLAQKSTTVVSRILSLLCVLVLWEVVETLSETAEEV